jgi:hypothetical protein
MSKYLESLASSLEACQHNGNLRIHRGAEELQVELVLGPRQQTVNITLKWVSHGGCHCLRFISRACIANDHRRIRNALETNNNLNFGALCLDTSTNPPVIDVTYTLVVEGSTCEDIVSALTAVAYHADNIEKQVTGQDVF